VEAQDPDLGTVLVYTLEGSPIGASIDRSSGLISWTPLEFGGAQFIIHVSDGVLFAAQTYLLNVTMSPSNHVPLINNVVGQTQTNVTQKFIHSVQVTDPDTGDELNFSLVQGPAEMIIDPNTGEIRWTPQEADLGEHTIIVKVTDGRGGSDTQTFKLYVVPMKKKPILPQPVSPGFNMMPYFILIIVAIIVAVIAAMIVLMKRKK
jgi:hypothetical protein